jgi:hypothetical protein
MLKNIIVALSRLQKSCPKKEPAMDLKEVVLNLLKDRSCDTCGYMNPAQRREFVSTILDPGKKKTILILKGHNCDDCDHDRHINRERLWYCYYRKMKPIDEVCTKWKRKFFDD